MGFTWHQHRLKKPYFDSPSWVPQIAAGPDGPFPPVRSAAGSRRLAFLTFGGSSQHRPAEVVSMPRGEGVLGLRFLNLSERVWRIGRRLVMV